MAAKKKASAPSKKPPAGGTKVGSKTKGYLDQGVRTALSKVDFQKVGGLGSEGPKKRVKPPVTAKSSSEGPKRRGEVRIKAKKKPMWGK